MLLLIMLNNYVVVTYVIMFVMFCDRVIPASCCRHCQTENVLNVSASTFLYLEM